MANSQQKQNIALVTGITGQDGAYMARLLLDKGYIVHGMRPYSAVPDTDRIESFLEHENFHLHYGDMADGGSLTRLISEIIPDEIYNFAAMSHVGVSFDMPEYTADIAGLGTLRLLEAIRSLGLINHTRFYQASSSEMFGNAPAPQNEETPFAPCSPYASAKVFAYWSVKNYREAYGLHASNGILFNHESPLRGEEFVTRKITKAIGRIEAGQQECLRLGNLDAMRDWGYAPDYMDAIYRMMQADSGDDYVIASGESRSVREFVENAFACIDVDIEWRGEGADEEGIDKATNRRIVKIDPQFFRPQEVHELSGDSTKAFQKLGWIPKTSFDEMVAEMVEADRIVGTHVKRYA